MSTWAMVAYACAALLALVLLRLRGAAAWYWHLLSLVAALAAGLTPIPPRWNTPHAGLIIGSLFVFLLCWAVAPPFVSRGRCGK